MTQPADLEEREHQEMLKKQESRKRFEEEQIKALREKKRLAELAAGQPELPATDPLAASPASPT